MLQVVVVLLHQVVNELQGLLRFHVENIALDQLGNEIPPMLRRYLKSIHSEAEENFSQALLRLGFLITGRYQLRFVIAKDLFGDKLRLFVLVAL